MGDIQRSNLEAAAAFYAAGPATSDEERRGFFASDFVWHVPGDTDLSGDYSGGAYFTEMPARMQPLDELAFHIESLAANDDLVVSVAKIQGLRPERTLDTTGGHILRFDADSRIIEAWGGARTKRALTPFSPSAADIGLERSSWACLRGEEVSSGPAPN